jgi:hypothetical protein
MAAAGALGGQLFAVRGFIGSYELAITSPANGTRLPALAVPVGYFLSSTGPAMDAEFQAATDAGFSNLVYSNTFSGQGSGAHSFTVSAGLVNKTTYYLRGRVTEAGLGAWGAWSPVVTFTPDLDAGKGWAYSNFNIGADYFPDPDVAAFVDFNVGAQHFPDADAVHFVNENVGAAFFPASQSWHFAHWGDVSTNTPVPHLWFLKPAAGRSGDGIQLYCFGVGDLPATYAGVVEIDMGGGQGWVSLPVVGWQTFPATPAAYTAARVLDPENALIDMQHTVVSVTIPADLLPPGYSLRLRTEGP